jgi:hypothetical protein
MATVRLTSPSSPGLVPSRGERIREEDQGTAQGRSVGLAMRKGLLDTFDAHF